MSKLRQEPVVSKVIYRCRNIKVVYKNGIKEIWHHRESHISGKYTFFVPKDPFSGNNIQIEEQKSSYDLAGKLPYLDYKKFKKANFFTQRIITHQLTNKLYEEGFTKVNCTPEELYEDLLKVNEADFSKMVKHGHFRISGVYEQPGRKLVSEFTDWGDVVKNNWTPKNIYNAIRKALKTNRHATRHNVIRYIAKRISHRYISPAYYNIFLKLFNIKNCTILDPYPSPSKAIAAIGLKCKYQSPEPYQELANFIGTKFYPTGNANVLILDYNFKTGDWQKDLKTWGGMCEVALICSENILPGTHRYVPYIVRPKNTKGFICVLRMKK